METTQVLKLLAQIMVGSLETRIRVQAKTQEVACLVVSRNKPRLTLGSRISLLLAEAYSVEGLPQTQQTSLKITKEDYSVETLKTKAAFSINLNPSQIKTKNYSGPTAISLKEVYKLSASLDRPNK